MAHFGEGGKRVGSGRKGYDHERMVKKILESTGTTIEQTFRGVGRFKDLDPEIIFDAMVKFHIKAMPQRVEGDMNHTFTEMGKITRNGNPLEARIG